MIIQMQKKSRGMMMSGSYSENSPTLKRNVPTWASYNSMLLVVNENRTDWKNLYTAIKTAYEIRKTIYPEGKTIISLDL